MKGNLTMTSEAVRRANETVVDTVKTTVNSHETSSWLQNSISAISLTNWNWDKLVEQTKRAHLDYFAQRASVENYFPLIKRKIQTYMICMSNNSCKRHRKPFVPLSSLFPAAPRSLSPAEHSAFAGVLHRNYMSKVLLVKTTNSGQKIYVPIHAG